MINLAEKNIFAQSNKIPHTIIVIAPTMSQPRYHKRATLLSKIAQIKVFAFSRGLYEESKFPGNISIYRLGRISDRSYIKRIIKVIRAVFIIKQELKQNKNPIYYAFSLDCVIIAKLSGIKLGFLEVGDLILPEGLGTFSKIVERVVLRYVQGIFLTSQAHLSGYYRKEFEHSAYRNRFYIVENKLSSHFLGKRPELSRDFSFPIKIGVIGLLRYEKPLHMLVNFVEKFPDKYSVHCFGDGPLKEYISSINNQNIQYYGSFRNPEHLADIYSQVDVSYVVYDNSLKNVRLAIPNKLFESAFYGVPILCADGTHLQKRVENWGIGAGISLETEISFQQGMIDYLTEKKLSKAVKNCQKLNDKDLIENDLSMFKRIIHNVLK